MGRPKILSKPVKANVCLEEGTIAWLRGGKDRPLSIAFRELVEDARLIEVLREAEIRERFWNRVRKRSCWKYRCTGDGHPVLSVEVDEGVLLVPAHRASWLMAYGTITPGKVVLQSCGQAACVRPAHLYLGEAE